jgi:histidyl-tRNA synthetase
MEIELKNLKGTRDYLPGEQKLRNKIRDTLEKVFLSYGYESVAIPIPIENLEPVGDTIDENKNRAVERIPVERILDDGGKTIERFSHIDGTG